MVLTKKPDWKEVLNGKARLVHQQIASLQRWVENAGGGEKMLDELSAPYYDLLQSIYEEDFPLASSTSKTSIPGITRLRQKGSPKAEAHGAHTSAKK